MKKFQSTKTLPLGSCAFRQPFAGSHCKLIHGYRLQAKLWFGCSKLDENNWVFDFGGLKELKAKLESTFDHTTCIAKNDPHLETFKDLQSKGIIDLRIFETGVGIERFAEFVFDTANHHIKEKTFQRCWVDRVEVWEHEGNSAICELSLHPEKIDVYDWSKGKNVDTTEVFETLEPLKEKCPDCGSPERVSDPKTQEKGPAMSSDPKPSESNCRPVPFSNPVTKGMHDPFKGTRWASNV